MTSVRGKQVIALPIGQTGQKGRRYEAVLCSRNVLNIAVRCRPYA